MEDKNRRTQIWTKAVSLILSISLYSFGGFTVSDLDRSISSLSPVEANQRIESLKRSLISAKGTKRGKIIKRIAEIENKVLEKYLNSSASRR